MRNFWWHLAVGLSFLRVDKHQWCLSIRPERHLTSDGVTPLPPKQIGRRVTSKKARMWNDIYLGEVNFWRDYLSGGSPKLVSEFRRPIGGHRHEDADLRRRLAGNSRRYQAVHQHEPTTMDLFSRSEYDDALAGDGLDWEDDDEGSEADEEN